MFRHQSLCLEQKLYFTPTEHANSHFLQLQMWLQYIDRVFWTKYFKVFSFDDLQNVNDVSVVVQEAFVITILLGSEKSFNVSRLSIYPVYLMYLVMAGILKYHHNKQYI